MCKNAFVHLLRGSFGLTDFLDVQFSYEDWEQVHKVAECQSIVGLLSSCVRKASESTSISRNLAMRWSVEAEAIRGINKKMDAAACQLTRIFAELGCRSVILKGQANALLYPDPDLRQSGDIDIWVEGGRQNVLEVLSKVNLIEDAFVGLHDVTLPARHFGFPVEVHFQACSGNRNPISNHCLQKYLNQELKHISPCSKGFNVPSVKFALVMQLSHILRHFLTVGIGLRQIVDYYFLLKSSTKEDRIAVSRQLKKFGLKKIAGALMWVLRDLFFLEEDFFLCPVDCNRGKRLLADVLEGGDFGQYSKRARGSLVGWWLKGKIRLIDLLFFDFPEVSWQLFQYVMNFTSQLPNCLKIAREGKLLRKRP